MSELSSWLAERQAREQELDELLASVVGQDRAGGQMRELAAEIVDAVSEIDVEDRAGAVVNALELLGSIQGRTNPLASYHHDNRQDELSRASRDGRQLPKLNELWRRKDVQAAFNQGDKYPNGVAVEQDELSGYVFSYVQARWANCIHLERLMLDALVYAEVDGFGRAVKEGNLGLPTDPKKIFFRGLRRWLWLAIIAGVCGLGIGDRWGFWPGVATAVVIYNLMLIGYSLIEMHLMTERLRVTRLLGDMQAFYKEIGEPNVSPTWLWHQLTGLASKGAVWKAGTGALIQHALRRNPTAWQRA